MRLPFVGIYDVLVGAWRNGCVWILYHDFNLRKNEREKIVENGDNLRKSREDLR